MHCLVGKMCPALERSKFTNGTIVTTKTMFHFNDTVTFKCDLGYVLNGTEMLTCEDDGMWSAAIPFCQGEK